MRLFLDTSSLIKLCHEETGSDVIQNLFASTSVSSIFLSELTRIEFLSALWKKCRSGELPTKVVRQIVLLFEEDTSQFNFVPINEDIVTDACGLINKYGLEGLRSLDGIQLSTAVSLRGTADLFLTSDRLLQQLFMKEHLPTEPI